MSFIKKKREITGKIFIAQDGKLFGHVIIGRARDFTLGETREIKLFEGYQPILLL